MPKMGEDMLNIEGLMGVGECIITQGDFDGELWMVESCRYKENGESGEIWGEAGEYKKREVGTGESWIEENTGGGGFPFLFNTTTSPSYSLLSWIFLTLSLFFSLVNIREPRSAVKRWK